MILCTQLQHYKWTIRVLHRFNYMHRERVKERKQGNHSFFFSVCQTISNECKSMKIIEANSKLIIRIKHEILSIKNASKSINIFFMVKHRQIDIIVAEAIEQSILLGYDERVMDIGIVIC